MSVVFDGKAQKYRVKITRICKESLFFVKPAITVNLLSHIGLWATVLESRSLAIIYKMNIMRY